MRNILSAFKKILSAFKKILSAFKKELGFDLPPWSINKGLASTSASEKKT